MKTTYFLLAFLLLIYIQPTHATEPQGEESHGDDPVEAMMHHIADANEFHLFGDYSIPLPCIAWSSDGMLMCLSSTFEHGHKAYKGYTMHHGILMKIKGENFPQELVSITGGGHQSDHAPHTDTDAHQTVSEQGISHTKEHSETKKSAYSVSYNGNSYELEPCKALQNVGSSWLDFSITKNVFAMLLALLILLLVFSKVTKAYLTNVKKAPKGLQSLTEILVIFIRDEVVKPSIGKEWKKFFPFIMSLFSFILVVNMLGLIPFFPGSANVSGNIGFTMVLAIFVLIVVNKNGNAHYWGHILWMPGIPTWVKPLMTLIEVIGIFMKPITLLIRLFANITAGHIIILSLVSLIFFFTQFGGVGGGVAGITLAVPFVFALNMLELFVSFLQAFVFSLLASLYIGSAVAEHHTESH